MEQYWIELPDGTKITSGAEGQALGSLLLERSVNEGALLQPGSACAAFLEVTFLELPAGMVQAGDQLTLYSPSGKRLGIFLAQKPERLHGGTYRVRAYDRMTLMDKDLTAFLADLTGWPYTLQELSELVCDACGVTLSQGPLRNGGHPVEAFSAEGVTGRQILRWIAQADGSFVRVTAQGDLEFAWYTPGPLGLGATAVAAAEAVFQDKTLSLQVDGITADGALFLESPYISLADDGAGGGILELSDALLQQFCYENGMGIADDQVLPIEKVQLRKDEADVGTVYPDGISEAVNTYRITANPLLTAGSGESLVTVAQNLYEHLKDLSYTPCTLSLPETEGIEPGQRITLKDAEGNTATVLVMTHRRHNGRDTVTCVGTPYRESSDAVNNSHFETLSGKVLHLRTDVDGICAENADQKGRLSRLELTVDGIRGQVLSQEGLRQELTELNQTAQSLSLAVKTMEEQGASKVVTSFGMTVDGSAVTIARQDSNMENRLDEKGMQVLRDPGTAYETVMLRADAAGVAATDVTVGNFLVVGDHARFENYEGSRTACFYLN